MTASVNGAKKGSNKKKTKISSNKNKKTKFTSSKKKQIALSHKNKPKNKYKHRDCGFCCTSQSERRCNRISQSKRPCYRTLHTRGFDKTEEFLPKNTNGTLHKLDSEQVKLQAKKSAKIGCRDAYDKINYCVFCGKPIRNKVTRHFFSEIHKDEPRISQIRALPKHSTERRTALHILINEGNYKHNVKVWREQKGIFVVARRKSAGVEQENPVNYMACQHCKKLPR